MERVVRVNASRGSSGADAALAREIVPREPRRVENPWERVRTLPTAVGDQGPCLYLGPGGQRCDRRAVAGGFCARHGKNAGPDAPEVTLSPRKLIAILAAAVALWPILADVIRAILRYIHR